MEHLIISGIPVAMALRGDPAPWLIFLRHSIHHFENSDVMSWKPSLIIHFIPRQVTEYLPMSTRAEVLCGILRSRCGSTVPDIFTRLKHGHSIQQMTCSLLGPPTLSKCKSHLFSLRLIHVPDSHRASRFCYHVIMAEKTNPIRLSLEV